MKIPTFQGELLEFDPTPPKPTEAYKELKAAIDALVSVPVVPVTYDEELRTTQLGAEDISKLLNAIIQRMTRAEDHIGQLAHSVSTYRVNLCGQLLCFRDALLLECKKYTDEVERRRKEEEEKRNAALLRANEKKQHAEDIMFLRETLAFARQVADNADRLGEPETAKDIRTGIQRFHSLDTSPETFQNPRKEAQNVRALVTKALQREQERKNLAH